jgi:hypothetical protein
MIWHHEFLIALYLGYIEVRHFTYFIGPKFSVFYNVYSNYEYQQLANMWSDCAEMAQHQHLRHTKEQLEYNRIDAEYEFVKKRALINYLTNSKLNAEASFHNRAIGMLNSIQNFEQANLKNEMRQVAVGALDKVLAQVEDPQFSSDIKRASFLSALDGIRTGVMTYSHDMVLPMIETEMAERLVKFQGMTKEDEGKLLSLSELQKTQVAEIDRRVKNNFIAGAPVINHGTVKNHEKYKSYMTMALSSTK